MFLSYEISSALPSNMKFVCQFWMSETSFFLNFDAFRGRLSKSFKIGRLKTASKTCSTMTYRGVIYTGGKSSSQRCDQIWLNNHMSASNSLFILTCWGKASLHIPPKERLGRFTFCFTRHIFALSYILLL